MNERVVEILVYIMTEMNGMNSQSDKLEVISRDLLQRGYSQHEISFAFSWLFERYNGETEELQRNTGASQAAAFRVLHEAERIIIAREAYGYLLQLKQLRLLNDMQIEFVIERAMMAGLSRINEAEIKALVAAVLFSPEGASEGAFFFHEENKTIH